MKVDSSSSDDALDDNRVRFLSAALESWLQDSIVQVSWLLCSQEELVAVAAVVVAAVVVEVLVIFLMARCSNVSLKHNKVKKIHSQ